MFAGTPKNWTSNFNDGSTIVDALCILKDNDQPLFKYNSTVFWDLGLNLIFIISVGKSACGIISVAFEFLPFLFNSPLRLND